MNCPSCQAATGPGDRFCGECGSPLDVSTPVEPADPGRRNADARFQMGIRLHQSGDFHGAISAFDDAIDLDPKNPEYYLHRGNAWALVDDYDSAITDFTRSIDLDPDNFQAYLDRGFWYSFLGDQGRALADYNKVIALNPQSASAYFNRAQCHRSRGDIDSAITDFERVLKLSQDRDLMKETRTQLAELKTRK